MDAVHRYKGTVNQLMGDGIMALFGHAALDTQGAIRRKCRRGSADLRDQDRGSQEEHGSQGWTPRLLGEIDARGTTRRAQRQLEATTGRRSIWPPGICSKRPFQRPRESVSSGTRATQSMGRR
jgi:hypothetical protein